MTAPKFSLITATFNTADYLACCLDSVCHQGIQAEHLLLDGGSTDGTLEIVKAHAKPVTRDSSLVTGESESSLNQSPITNPHSLTTRFISEPDHGIYDAMNKGLRLATGEIIGILNADDFYANERVLERVAKVFEDPSVEACYGDLVYVKETPVTHDSSLVTGEGESSLNQSPITNHQSPDLKVLRYWKSGPFHPDKFRWGWMPPHPTFFVRRSVYEKYGLFNLDLGSAADYELMLRFLYKHRIKVAYIPEVLVCMRAGGVSNASLNNRIKANRMDRKAWEVNRLKPYPWTLFLKPLRKIPQWFEKP